MKLLNRRSVKPHSLLRPHFAFLLVLVALLATLCFASIARGGEASWSFQPSSWDFGLRYPGDGPSEPHPFTLTNTGEVSLSPGFVSISSEGGTGIELAGNTCHSALAPGASCTVNVTFDPPSAGSKEATLEVAAAGAKAPPAVATLTGTGGGPVVTIEPAAVDFGSVQFGGPAPAPRTITVGNQGPPDLSLADVSLRIVSASGPTGSILGRQPFQLTGGSCEAGQVLPPAGTCTLAISFSPTAPGTTFLEQLQIADNAADSPQVVPISAATLPAPELRPPQTLPPGSPRAVLSRRRPGKHTKARGATFWFRGSPTAVRFLCKLDTQTFHPCQSPLRYHNLRLGWHRLAIRALDGNGLIGTTAAVYRWRIVG